MAVQLNHTIVGAKDPAASSAYLAEMLGFGDPARYGHFWIVETDNGVSLDFIEDDDPVPQHYAFLVGEDDWDTIFARIQERRLEYWADPAQQRPGEINTNDGGRGVYWLDPDGHFLEIITRPYGSGTA